MSDHSVAPELVDAVRRWAARLRNADADSTDLENQIVRVAREIQDEQKSADQRFAALYQTCPAGVVLTDRDGVIVAANPAFLRLTATTSEDELLGAHIAGLGAADHDQRQLRAALAAVAAAEHAHLPEQLEIRSAADDGRFLQVTASAIPRDGTRHPIFMFEDVRHPGSHDPLTGLPDGAHLRSELRAVLADEGADEGADESAQQVALLLVDLDGFRVVSDGLDTDMADQVLRGVASTLAETFDGHGAFVARLLGDTFAVVMRGDFTPAAVGALAEEAIANLARPVFVHGLGVGVSASVGIAVADRQVTRHTEMIRSAQVALHRAKELGKAQWVLFDPVAGKADRERYQLACGIAGALETGEMTVIYDPHVVLPDAQIVTSLNAVLRWNHPTLGALQAEQFYSLAERTGMTVPLGRYLLSEALRTAGSWRTRFAAAAPVVCLTLPRRMAIDADLVNIVQTELDRNGLEPRHLMLCTDGPALLDERGDLLESLGHLAELGVVFILNITGMSELELVPALQVPVPAVMLTGAIIEALEIDDPPAWAERNIRQLVERAEELGIKVGAHGVISQEHAELLFGVGVVVGAGPYLPTYVTSAEAETWVGRTFPMG